MRPFLHPGAQFEAPTLVLQTKSGESLGAVDGAADITYKRNFNSANELSFTVSKYLDGKPNPLWNALTDLKNIYVPEFQERFEIKISSQEEATETKAVTGTSLCEAELGQILLRGLEINTDQDHEINSTDEYPATVFYIDIKSSDSPETIAKKRQHSLLHRVLSGKASFYKIGHVDESLKDLAYTFSADGTSVYDFLTGEVAKQMECLFVFDSMTREIHAYALSDQEEQESSLKINPGAPSGGQTWETPWHDTVILIDRENLASSLTCEGDVDSLKNCFYVEGGDESINAAFIQINPSGDQYLYYFSPEALAEMPKPLRDAISAYNEKSENYLGRNPKKPGETTHRYQQLPGKDASYMAAEDFNPQKPDSLYSREFQKVITEITSLDDGTGNKPYSRYGYTVPEAFTSQEELVTAYYNGLDFYDFLEHSMMPDYKMEEYDKYHALALLNSENLGIIGIAGLDFEDPSQHGIENAVKNKAKSLINTALYSVSIDTLRISPQGSKAVTWTGIFSITDRRETDSAVRTVSNSTYQAIAKKEDYNLSSLHIPTEITLTINNDVLSYAKNSIAAMLAKKDLPMAADLYSPEVTETAFREKIPFYGLDSLDIMQNVLTDCLGILQEQLEKMENTLVAPEQNDIYKELIKYRISYHAKQSLVSGLSAERERQLSAAEAFILLMEAYLSEVKQELDFEQYLISYGKEHGLNQNLWEIFQYYRREGEYQNSNLLSTGLTTNAEILGQARKLMEFASKELATAGTMQYKISTTMDNLLALPEFASVSQDFDVGNWIRVRMDVQDGAGSAQIYKLRLLSLEINYDTEGSPDIQVEFSTVTRTAGGVLSDVESILDSAQAMAKSYGYTAKQAAIASKTTETVERWVSDGLDLTNQQIQNNADNQSLVIDSSGLLARKQDPLTELFDPCQIRIMNNGIYTTHDNWNTTDAALGKFWYRDPDNNWEPTQAYGIIARKLVGEQILGEDLRITNLSGSMQFTEHGLTISNGLNTITLQTDTPEPSGQPGRIFLITAKKVNPDGTPQEEELLYTDTNGDLHITGTLNAQQITTGSGKFSVDPQGLLRAEDAEVSGTIHASDGSFTGTVHATGGTFSGDITCTGSIQGGAIQGTEISGSSIQGTEISGSSIQGTEISGGSIQGTEISGGSIQGNNISGGTIVGSKITGGSININNNFTVDSKGGLQAKNAELSGSIDAKRITAMGSYLIYDKDNENEVPIISCVPDDTTDTNLRFGRLTNPNNEAKRNFIAFNDTSAQRSIHLYTDYFRFTTGDYDMSFKNQGLACNKENLRFFTKTHCVVLTDDAFRPSAFNEGKLDLGSSAQPWNQLFCTNTQIQLSDRNLKEQIAPISPKYETLFHLIEPVTYKLKSSGGITHDRIHIGCISQQVEEAMMESGLSPEELSFFCKDPDPEGSGFRYALRYPEWIMLNTHMLQKTRRELQEATRSIAALQQDNLMLRQELDSIKKAIKNLQEVH